MRWLVLHMTHAATGAGVTLPLKSTFSGIFSGRDE
jgi:hypothetical protein